MIIQENIIVDGIALVKSYSDMYTIRQVETGIVYESAVDIPGKYTYLETDEYNTQYLEQLNN
jgi:hypothetical protein